MCLGLQQNIGSELKLEYRLADWPETAKSGAVLNASGLPTASCTARFQNICGRVDPPRNVTGIASLELVGLSAVSVEGQLKASHQAGYSHRLKCTAACCGHAL